MRAVGMMLCGALAAMSGGAAAQLAPGTSVSFFRAGGEWRPALFVCDGIGADRVHALTPPAPSRQVELWTFAKPGLGAGSVRLVLGEGDAGMSQVVYPLARLTGDPAGAVNTVSPDVVEPGATTPTVTSVTLGGARTTCRFAPQTRVLGVTARRSVQVTAEGNGSYRYRSYDHDTRLAAVERPWGGRDTRASLTIRGGRLIDRDGGRRVYEFANAGYVYRVLAGVGDGRVGGGVQVFRDGRQIVQEPFAAYTGALQP